MRVRHIKNIENKFEILKKKYNFIENESFYIGKWKEIFFNKNPIHIELGCGKGNFIVNISKKYRNINFVGIEKDKNILYKALLNSENQKNLFFILTDIKDINKVFKKNEINRIYINFPDPWPKNKHEKRRLTNKFFLDIYKNILKKNGEIFFKTDNLNLFNYTLKFFITDSNWIVKNLFINYNTNIFKNFFIDEITEYEEKYKKLNKPIFKLHLINSK